MKKLNFNRNWQFTFEEKLDAYNNFGLAKYSNATGAPARFYKFSNWQHIDLPHDWAAALPKDLSANTFAGARANTHYHRFRTEQHSDIEEIYNIGWYRKEFPFNKEWTDKRIFIEFEGIFRDAVLWVNGVYIDRYASGYTSFTVEITDHLVANDTNSIAVRVDSDQPEGWFYEGSGIYRNVNLLIGEPVYFKPNKTFIKSYTDGTVNTTSLLVNDTETDLSQEIVWTIKDKNDSIVATATKTVSVPAYNEKEISAEMKIESPLLWHVDSPNLYTLHIEALDKTIETFGIRSIVFDAEKGFFLNGKPLKLHGACVHQDFGGVGTALSDNLNYYKIRKLKQMGVNAYRAAHHAPSPAILRACDELGMLVMDETRAFGTSPEAIRQLTALIERDRNHPSVIIWCIGNEEVAVQDIEWSNRLVAKMTRIVKSLDDTRPVTYGGNNGSNFIGANGASEIRGINYIRNGAPSWVDEYHSNHPEQPIIGTEESSYVLSRSGTKNDLGSGRLDATGNVTMRWGSTPKGWVKFFEEHDFLAGGFMWTGFDYHGEPNPFENANVSSSFGAIDLCGIEKPIFWYYKAWWNDDPVLKIAPHWNYKEGELAEISVYTNCDEVTLFVNNKSLGSKAIEKFNTPVWKIPFEPGVISVEGTKDGITYRDEIRTSGKVHEIRCIPVLIGKTNEDISIIQLEAVDKNGLSCLDAANSVELTIADGKIIGVCNGDPACLDYEQKPLSEEAVFLRTFNIDGYMFTIPPKATNKAVRRYDFLYTESKTDSFEDDFRLVVDHKKHLEEPKTYSFTTTISHVSNFQYIEFERFSGEATVYLNGMEIGNNHCSSAVDYNTLRPYRFYCDFIEGENEIKVEISTYEYHLNALSGYVKVGKIVDEPWTVCLHNGKARAFVKASDPKALTAKLITV